MKKKIKLQNLKWWFFMRKIRFSLWWCCQKRRYNEIAHCENGFHYMERDGITLTIMHPKKKERKYETIFFKCRVCNLIQFPTEKDKRNWEFIEKRQNDNMKKLVQERIKKLGCTKSNKNKKSGGKLNENA